MASPTSVVLLEPPKSAVVTPASMALPTAFSMALPSSNKFKDNFNIIAADKIVAIGLTLPFGKSGAEP
ncbi:unnamed protein product [Ambrosiozyma monospora]|uniref:Unnamed protein product n=1 Tax=Ambrosiozyma monospora TaxID=43982 RepID=A0A9W6T8R5_AMBMO|nr:unnamed protein product [Ambrosiozyma monospora]